MRKLGIFLIALSMFCTAGVKDVQALSLVSFQDYDFSGVRFGDRIRISSDLLNPEFETALSEDRNADGQTDFLEVKTFFVSGKTANVYLGNKHNRFDISKSLLYVGVEGVFDSLQVNDLFVTGSDAASIHHPSVFLMEPDLTNHLDTILLFEINQKLEDREPSKSPIASNNPVSLLFQNVISNDEDLRFYMGAYGAISSGTYNSFTPDGSSVLWMPEITRSLSEAGSKPIPEPATFLLSSVALLTMYLKRKEEL